MSDEKKIIIDEDWKSQVAAEKEAAKRQSGEPASGQTASGEPASAGGPAAPQASHGPIPASFDLLVTTFVTEAMVALGQLPHPADNQLVFDSHHARFAIDMLEIIAEKTKGNLTPQEDRGLHDVLHQLRMAFVAISSQQSAVSSNIETP
jgi:hypothetical protein